MEKNPDIIMISNRVDTHGVKLTYETSIKVFFDSEGSTWKSRTIHEYTISKTESGRYYKAYRQEFRLFDYDEGKNTFKKESIGQRLDVAKKEMKLICSDIEDQIKKMKPCKWNDSKIETYYKK